MAEQAKRRQENLSEDMQQNIIIDTREQIVTDQQRDTIAEQIFLASKGMVVFFACLDRLTKSVLNETSRFILLDGLFKRYLREEDLDEAVLSMDVARRQFQFTTVDSIDLVGLGLDKNDTFLSFDDINLAEGFEKYFNGLARCVRSYKSGRITSGYYYNPVKVSRVDLPGYTEDHARPEKAYDDLVGPPFWFPKATRNDSARGT